ncbi:hypothetical protein DBR43_31815 [Pedobacter sp. KBW06]|uniref:AAA family ATPase n=1 Tax=Pedobacter sp. KBW06 TaxID=2153359 RepID=UPI000F59CEA1|nr:AAA family ATPase [Pedobacter sp. KBW06]RQO64868.1 hypothetical protein DBR43_31815 [Pedobacter sp. KBW06]
MRIQTIIFNKHKVLGDVNLDLLIDHNNVSLEDIDDTNIKVAIDDTSAPNQYSYIIGENGVGKTFFFRTITHAMNLGSAIDSKLRRFQSLNQEDQKYGTKPLLDGAIIPLQKMGVHTNNETIIMDPTNDHGNDFLSRHNGQLILITSTVENKIVHRNSRFRSFNHQSPVNVTSYLFLRALFKNYQNNRIKRLNQLLEHRKDAQWKVRYRLPIDFQAPAIDDKIFVMLGSTKSAFIHDFLRVLSNLKRDDKGDLTVKNPVSKIDYSVVENLYRSGSFFKLYFDHTGSDAEFFKDISESPIIKSLNHFMKSIELTPEKTVAGNFEISKDQHINWGLELDLNELSIFEINLLALLVEHQAVELDIFIDDIPLAEMSSGQQNMIRLFSYFSDMPLSENPENCIVFFDEPENSLHPKWQQEFPENFRDIAETVYEIKNSHFLFATHSPVLIMKAAQNANTDVLRFSRDSVGNLTSEMIDHVNTFSIEEVLLDEFKISYRSQRTEAELKKFLDTKKVALPAHDPIASVRDSFDLKQKITELFNKSNSVI